MYEEDKNKNEEMGSWWADYQSQDVQETAEEIYYEETYSDRRKKFLIIGIIAAVVILLLVGGGVAYALLSQQPQEQEQPTEQVEAASTDAQSEVTVYITADGTNEKSGAAKVVISSLSGEESDSEEGSDQEDESSSESNNENNNASVEGQASENANAVSVQQVAAPAADTTDNEGNAEQAPSNDDPSAVDANEAGEVDTSSIEGTIIQEREITPNETVSIGNLDPGDYRLTVVSVPVNEDGSTYQIPMNATDFSVSGDGKVVSVFVYLPKVVDGQIQEPTEDELAAAQQQATGSLETSDQAAASDSANAATSDGASGGSSSGGSSSSGGTQAHTHNWVAQTKTVHHEAVYRTVHHEAVKQRITVCTTCGADITNNYTAHKNATGHTGYRYDTKVIRDAYDEQVLVSGAYDETVVTGYKCSECGATR